MDALMDAIDLHGWGVKTDGISPADSLRLKSECEHSCAQDRFHLAAVGRGSRQQVHEGIRNDQILWLQPEAPSVEQAAYLAQLEIIRLALNQRFFLGLFDFEGHFAIYPQGAFYKPHLDRHIGTNARVVTVILYLNPHWQPGDGGELKLWTTPGEKTGPFTLIEPRLGTLVCFLAADFWHEVMPAIKTRMSITGWFRQR